MVQLQAWRSKFDHQCPCKRPGMVVSACNQCWEGRERRIPGGSLASHPSPTRNTQDPMREPISKNEAACS